MGQLSSSNRQRITNVGEGTIDLGTFVSVGRIDSLRAGSRGIGFWSAMLELGARYRSHNHDFA